MPDEPAIPEPSKPPPAEPKTPPQPAPDPVVRKPKRRRLLIGMIVVALIVIAIPAIRHALNTVSTDDAYVNSHVTFVAPRVAGQVAEVLVDDNYRVNKGDVLVRLDPEPFRVQVAIQQSEVDAAQAALVTASANVEAQVGQTRSMRFKLDNAIENVGDQVQTLKERVATLGQNQASQVLAQQEFDRASNLLKTNVVSKEEYDERFAALNVAKAQTAQALENVREARAALGLPTTVPEGESLADVPPDLDQTFSGVRAALFALLQSAGQIGIFPSSFNLTPKQVLAEFYKRDPSGNIDVILGKIVPNAPGIRQAEAVLENAKRNLDQAKLNLSYCTIVSEIDGVVTRRNVNPGDNVQVGQSLMAVRSLREVWVDANFKETQLRRLRIGQHVDLETDMYGSKQKFEGRISGFTMGTGSTLALLPAENATGNFVKVVQRLPVRIDLVNYDPDKLPLFVGISVTPHVDLKSEPTGPDAGKYLQTVEPAAVAMPEASPAPTP